MSEKSTIEWTDATWSPVTGCTKVSPGCSRCYIERTIPFHKGHRKFEYQGKEKGVTTGVELHPERLSLPLGWKKPKRIFVNSLSDLFHEDIPWEFIAEVFGIMAKAHWHTFQVLTKRPQRMMEFLNSHFFINEVACFAPQFLNGTVMPWPLPNVWLGVSVENQYWADRRIPLLLQTPAAVRFVSAEPLLGPVDLTKWLECCQPERGCVCIRPNWVIIGGESGPGARPFNLAWAESLIEQFKSAGVPVFMKQLGRNPVVIGPVTGNEYSLKYNRWDNTYGIRDKKGGRIDEWPEELQIREFPRGGGVSHAQTL